MNRIPGLTTIFGIIGGISVVAASAGLTMAQDSTQTVAPQPAAAAQVPSSTMGMPGVRFIPQGYYPDPAASWPPERTSDVLRPLAPGYRFSDDCGIVFDPPPPYRQICSRSRGCIAQSITRKVQEMKSFHMYISGYGPAIHPRPASICW